VAALFIFLAMKSEGEIEGFVKRGTARYFVARRQKWDGGEGA
jgi:hypothetical protein